VSPRSYGAILLAMNEYGASLFWIYASERNGYDGVLVSATHLSEVVAPQAIEAATDTIEAEQLLS
jgi:hypothetical protein